MSSGKKLELLAPAKNLECGIAAIRHGADAVYIGAPRFGAREAAGNSIEEIERLASQTRLFGAKTYVALNTILYDNELEEAEKMIWQVYEAGADALIIQDFGILEMNLPPIALHASTQANNFTVEKIKFLAAVGFERAVLARELSLKQIETIASQTALELEVFVHGSLCVSLSGQCYMSHVMGGRSANRGACAQPCRKKYNLLDATGKVIVQEKHLLSLKDLNRSQSIRELAEAGVRSFKIEGRLKDLDYVKNITAFYRGELDRFLEQRVEYGQPSLGKTSVLFKPDPTKTFHRSGTDYFLHGRKTTVAQLDSPKSTGEEIGEVIKVGRDYFRISGDAIIANNDGLHFMNRRGESVGLKVNKVENGCIYPDKLNELFAGAKISRNYDHTFQMTLSKKSSDRKIPVGLALQETATGFSIKAYLERLTDGVSAFVATNELAMDKIPANNSAKSHENISRQLAKSGETPFLVSTIITNGNEQFFFTSQQLNELRRGALEALEAQRLQKPILTEADPTGKALSEQIRKRIVPNSIPFPEDQYHFENNISNRLARQFYRRHGIENPQTAVEKREMNGRLQVMITKHCIQHELGFCQRFGGNFPSHFILPFALQEGTNRFELEFDCRNCMMRVFKEN